MQDSSIAAALDVYAGTPGVLRSLLAALPEEIAGARADEGWSPRDVVVHLTSLDPLSMVGRVRAILEQDEPELLDLDEQEVLERSGLRDRPLADVIDEMSRTRVAALAWLSELTPAQLARTGRHSAAGRLSAGEIIHHKAWHDLLHVQQICRMISIPLDAQSGAMRRYH